MARSVGGSERGDNGTVVLSLGSVAERGREIEETLGESGEVRREWRRRSGGRSATVAAEQRSWRNSGGEKQRRNSLGEGVTGRKGVRERGK